MKLDRIVVAVDGSAGSVAAVEWAAGLAGATGAEVVAVHALGLLERMDGGDAVPSQPNRDEIQHRFEQEWCQPLDGAGIRSRRLVRDGSPVSVILAVADEEVADLVVLGSRGLGGYPELLLGSTSTQVAQRSRRPVTIVPGPA
jgi:nucleotide-binding universal stress UspA family protein